MSLGGENNLDAKQIYMDYITDSDDVQVTFDFDLKSKSSQTSRNSDRGNALSCLYSMYWARSPGYCNSACAKLQGKLF